jgi:transporter family protein
MNPAWSWQAWAVGAAAFAALTAIFAKVGVAGIHPDFATFFRTLVVAVALGFLLLATGQMRSPAGLSRRSLFFLVLSGLATGASWVCYFRALQLGPASRVAPIDKLSVVMVAIFGVAFLGERLTALNWLGVLLVALGAFCIGLK